MRHGAVSYFDHGRPLKPEDVPLTVAGRDQAYAAASMLRGIEFDRVLTSGLPRTVETAASSRRTSSRRPGPTSASSRPAASPTSPRTRSSTPSPTPFAASFPRTPAFSRARRSARSSTASCRRSTGCSRLRTGWRRILRYNEAWTSWRLIIPHCGIPGSNPGSAILMKPRGESTRLHSFCGGVSSLRHPERSREVLHGLSENVCERLVQHNSGVSKWTKGKGPWKLAWSSDEMALGDARKLENELKRQKGGVGFFAITRLGPHGGS